MHTGSSKGTIEQCVEDERLDALTSVEANINFLRPCIASRDHPHCRHREHHERESTGDSYQEVPGTNDVRCIPQADAPHDTRQAQN